MGQVLKISTTDFKAIHLSMGGRLVPSDLLDEARGRALRITEMEAQLAGKYDGRFQHEVDLNYQRASHVRYKAVMRNTGGKGIKPLTSPLTKSKVSTPNLYTASNTQRAAAESLEAFASGQALTQEKNAGYLQDRGAFEMRVQQGDLTYLPAMDMTIITQMPEVKFEYTGDFIYFPKNPGTGENVDIVS